MLYIMSLALFSLLSRLVETKSVSQILKRRTPFSRAEKISSSQLSCTVGRPGKAEVMNLPTNGDAEQLNVFGRNLNTVIRTLKIDVTVPIPNHDCRSKAKTGSGKGG